MVQECKLLDKAFTATDVDLVFSKVPPSCCFPLVSPLMPVPDTTVHRVERKRAYVNVKVQEQPRLTGARSSVATGAHACIQRE